MRYYMKSDWRRLRKKPINYTIILLGLLLLVGSAFALDFVASQNPGFEYATTKFYYATIVSAPNMLLLVTSLLAITLLGRDRFTISTSVGFGVKRADIFWGKYLVTLINFLMVFALFSGVAVAAGKLIIPTQTPLALHQFMYALLNLAPILISALTLVYTIGLVLNSEVGAFIIVFLCYRILDYASTPLLTFLPKSQRIIKHLPSTHFGQLWENFLVDNMKLEFINWGINLGIIIIVLLIGSVLYRRKNY